MRSAGLALFYVACALVLSACGGGGGGNDGNGGNATPSYSITASQSSISLDQLANAMPFYHSPSQSITVTYTGPTIDIRDIPDWLIVSSRAEQVSPVIFEVRPATNLALGDYSTTLRFRTAGADGSHAVFAEVAVSVRVEAGTHVALTAWGLASGSTVSARINDNQGVTLDEPGRFPMTHPVAQGRAFTVTVTQQPQNQRCTFGNADTATSGVGSNFDITPVMLFCNAISIPWTWMGGSQATGAEPVYGTRGAPSANTTPGAREPGAYAADVDGNLYLFGGASGAEFRNDLWRFDSNAGAWTWLSGSSAADNAVGVYGTRAVPDSNNVPGARTGAVAWIDGNGDFWLFGGKGVGAVAGEPGYLNDVWKYDVEANQWTWMGGSDRTNFYASGTYGATPSVNNIPGGRERASVVQDVQGDVWIFGGYGVGAPLTAPGNLNDLWRFTVSTGEWAWMSGADQPASASVYGTRGVPDPANNPGGRGNSAMWVDTSGNVWVFGGNAWILGDDARNERRGDLWRYEPGTDMWTWMSGSDQLNSAQGQYTSPGAATSDVPAARYGAAAWTDSAGNFWMFGGDFEGPINDLWKYTPATNTWSWLSGGKGVDAPAIYGTQGVAANTNVPSARSFTASWRDSSGRLWMYSGARNSAEFVDDLWRFDPQ